MTLFLILVGPILWSVGGFIGSTVISLIIPRNRYSKWSIIKSWTIGFGVGGFLWIILNPITEYLFYTLIGRQIHWVWSVIPLTVNIALTGIISAQVGSRMLFNAHKDIKLEGFIK